MLVNLRSHRRKGELDNVYFLCLLLCLSHKNFFRQLLCTTNNFLYHFGGGGIFFNCFFKTRFCFNFVVIAEDSDFFATFL